MSSKSDDPERLLAEALRAQAVSTPVNLPPLPKVLRGEEPPDEPEPEPEVEDAAPEEAEQPTPEEEPEEPAEVAKEQLTEEMMLKALTEGPTPTELATIRIEQTHHIETERFSPVENVLGPVGTGPGFGLLSGSEVGSSAGLPVSEPLPPPPPRPRTEGTTTRMPAKRARLNVWMILLLAVALGLAAGAVAALLSMV